MSIFHHLTWLVFTLLINKCISESTPSPTLDYVLDSDCIAKYESIGSTFNLCPLTIGSGSGQLRYYKVEDARNINTTTTNAASHTYVYYFNIGNKLQSIPPICANSTKNHLYCPKDTDCSGDENLLPINVSDNVWAFQVRLDENNEHDACWVIGQGEVEWSLVEEYQEDPSEGVQLTYLNGDYDDSVCKDNRKFNIRFECEDEVLFIPDEIPLYEYTPCEYTLTIPSQYGCPVECGIDRYNNKLCAGHGLCGYDNTNSNSRCFCFNKYIGDDCSIYDATADDAIDSQKDKPSGLFAYTFDGESTNGVEVTYDLRAFAAPEGQAAQNGGAYIIHDKDYESIDRRWTYYVAIAALLNPSKSDILPDFCKNIIGPCTQWNGTECIKYNEEWTGTGLVFQANNATQECFVLGRFTGSSPSADLYDSIDDPAKGVTITYSEGSWCESAKINREFRVNLVCPRDYTAIFDPAEETTVDLYEYIEEESTCIYAFTMESAVACPYQCITDTEEEDTDNEHAFTVCSQKGVCAADPEAGFVRCLCDDGWTGVDCNVIDSPMPSVSPTKLPTETPLSPETVTVTVTVPVTLIPYSDGGDDNNTKKGGYLAIIIILVVLILFVVVAGYIVYRNQKIKIAQQEDELSFHKMSDKGMGSDDANSSQNNNIIIDSKGKRDFATISQIDDGEEEQFDDDEAANMR